MLDVRKSSRPLALLSAALLALVLPAIAHATWAPEGTAVGPTVHSYGPTYADLEPGGVVGIRSLNTRQAHRNVVLGHVAPDGTLIWGDYIVWESLSLPAPDGSGGYFAVVQADFGTSVEPFRVLHQLPDGSWDPTWTAAGVLLSNNVYLQAGHHPACGSDGAGGVLVVSQLYGSTPAARGTFVQRFLANGTVAPGWPAEGRRLSAEYFVLGTSAVVGDGAGGAFALVSSTATGTVDLYHVLANGSLDSAWGGVYSVQAFVTEPLSGSNDAFLLSHGTSATAVFKTPGASGQDVLAFHFDADLPNDGGWATTLLSAPEGVQLQAFADGSGGTFAFWAVESPTPVVQGAHVDATGAFVSPTGLHGGSALPTDAVFTAPSSGGRFAAGPDGASGGAGRRCERPRGAVEIRMAPLRGDGVVPVTWRRWRRAARWRAACARSPRPKVVVGPVPRAATATGERTCCGRATRPNATGSAWRAWNRRSSRARRRTARARSRCRRRRRTRRAGGTPLPRRCPQGDARVELLDLAGRRVDAHALSGAGEHVVRLSEGRSLAPGLYFARLVQGREASMVRVSIVH